MLRLAQSTRLSTYLIALWRLVRHPQTPWYAKALAGFVLAYGLSPIDLIPDFLPVIGQLDDLVLIPLGIAAVVHLVPHALWQHCLDAAEQQPLKLPKLWWGAVGVVAVWLILLGTFAWWFGAQVVAGL